MLVLTRKISESIELRNKITGEVIAVTVVNHGGTAVRLGIDAARIWDIHRPETEIAHAARQESGLKRA